MSVGIPVVPNLAERDDRLTAMQKAMSENMA